MIRLANKNDLDSILYLGSILSSNFTKTYDIKAYLNSDKYIILVNEDEKVNGLLIVFNNIDYYELEVIVINQKDRNKGIASSLIKYFVDNYMKDKRIMVLEVATKNEAAVKLYQKHNFAIEGIRKNYYQDDDAYMMKLVIK